MEDPGVGFVPGNFRVLLREQLSQWRWFMKLTKLLKDNAFSSLSGNRVLTVTSQNRCFSDLQMFSFGGTKTLLFLKWSVKKISSSMWGLWEDVLYKLISHFVRKPALNSLNWLQDLTLTSSDFQATAVTGNRATQRLSIFPRKLQLDSSERVLFFYRRIEAIRYSERRWARLLFICIILLIQSSWAA